jgi:hypothetical protein
MNNDQEATKEQTEIFNAFVNVPDTTVRCTRDKIMIKGPSFDIIDLRIIRENGFEVKAYTWKRTLKPIGLWLLFSFSQRRSQQYKWHT